MSEPSRNREKLSVSVDDERFGKTVVTAYNGMLPEECLILLTEQNMSLMLRGNVERRDRERRWYGPSESIQSVIVKGVSNSQTGS